MVRLGTGLSEPTLGHRKTEAHRLPVRSLDRSSDPTLWHDGIPIREQSLVDTLRGFIHATMREPVPQVVALRLSCGWIQ